MKVSILEHPSPGPAFSRFCKGELTHRRKTPKVLEGEWETQVLGGEKGQAVWDRETQWRGTTVGRDQCAGLGCR